MRAHTFVHIPATAGTAIRKAIGSKRIIHDLARNHYQRPGVNWSQYFVYSFVRNSYDRAVSLCAKVHASRKRQWLAPAIFKLWVREGMSDTRIAQHAASPRMCTSQLDFLWDVEGNWLVDFVGRYEKLDEDVARVCRHLGIPTPEVAHLNVSVRERDYRKYYDDVTRERVAARYADELKELKYTF